MSDKKETSKNGWCLFLPRGKGKKSDARKRNIFQVITTTSFSEKGAFYSENVLNLPSFSLQNLAFPLHKAKDTWLKWRKNCH